MSDMREPGGERERKTWEALEKTMRGDKVCEKCGQPLEWYLYWSVRCYESCKNCEANKDKP